MTDWHWRDRNQAYREAGGRASARQHIVRELIAGLLERHGHPDCDYSGISF